MCNDRRTVFHDNNMTCTFHISLKKIYFSTHTYNIFVIIERMEKVVEILSPAECLNDSRLVKFKCIKKKKKTSRLLYCAFVVKRRIRALLQNIFSLKRFLKTKKIFEFSPFLVSHNIYIYICTCNL